LPTACISTGTDFVATVATDTGAAGAGGRPADAALFEHPAKPETVMKTKRAL